MFNSRLEARQRGMLYREFRVEITGRLESRDGMTGRGTIHYSGLFKISAILKDL